MFTLECRQRWSLSPPHRSNVTTCLVHSSSLSSTRSFPPSPVSSSWPAVDTHPTVVGRTHKVKASQALSHYIQGCFEGPGSWIRLRRKDKQTLIDSFWPPPPIFSIHKDPIMSSLRIYQLNSYFSFLEYSSFYSPFANVYKPKKCISDLLAGP